MFLLLYLFFFNKEVSGLAGQNIYDVTCYFEFDKGEAYNGTVNTTINGKACINWKTYHSNYTYYYEDHNYCRNPRTDAFDQPWCYYADGYKTAVCSITACVCKPGRFGKNCEQVCHCKEPDCNDLTGHCSYLGCEEEWTGPSCNVCISNRFGEKCEGICHCKEPGCDHVTGHCNTGDCFEGWTGESCNECSSQRFGQNCERVCHCQHGECNNITGVCYKPGCRKGWTGDSCNYMCISNRFGEKCEGLCHCKEPGCDHVTGHCNTGDCSEGWTGESCNECSSQRFGQNCERVCHCQHGECNNITGVCYKPGCRKGWTGHSCNYTTDCVLKMHDTTYKGTVNITQSNESCKRWEHAVKTQYHTLEENFCRNPSFDHLDYPWCYTESGNPNYDTCAIPLCVCQPGFYGNNCQSKCHCAVDGCNTITGVCNNPTAGCKVPWTGRKCATRFSCPDLQASLTSQLLKPTTLTGYHINDTVQFLCNRGFALVGPDTLICVINDSQTGGKWDNSQPVCQNIECNKSSLHLTDIEVINTRTNIFNFGEVAHISCKQGYIGEAKLTKCININKWTDNRPVCRAVPCPDINMTESIELPTKLTKYHLQDIAIFKCKSGYILSGNDTLTCLAYSSHPVGKWSSVQPICIDSTSNTFPAADVGAGVGSVLAIILIVAIVVFLVKRRQTLKHRPQKSTSYKETPFESTISEEAEFKGDLKKIPVENDRGIILSVNNDNTYYNKVEVDEHYSNEEDGEGYYSFTLDKQIPRSAVLMKDFYDYVENGREVGGKLEFEFAKLKSGLQKPTHSALKPGNKLKNKYKNMYAYDETRVVLDVLEGSPLSDYINASFIHGYGQVRKYIASQGPLDHTVNDFWRMVWQCDCGKIVMLTNVFEEGKHKCIQYWPEEENHKVAYGAIDIFLIKEEVYSDFVVRIIKMQRGSVSKVVKQFHFTVWPDKNVPKYSSSLVHFRHKVNNTEVSCTGPMVVHCSAGIGRTGTFIGLDYVANQAKEVDFVDVFGCVEGLRRQRVNMVQTQRQYVFLHDAVLEALMCPNAGIPSKDFQEDYNKLLEFDSIKKKVKLRVQYEAMNKISRRHKEEEFDKGKSLENKTKNRYSNIMPVGSEIPLLSTAVDGHNEYINAVFLPGYKNSKAFIVTQMPLEDTKVDLWRLVYDYNISSIVMLNQSYDSRDVYWPESGELSVTSGPFIIEQTNIETSRLYQLLKLKIGYNNKDQRNLKIFQAKFWSDSDVVPKDSSDIFSFIDVVENDCNNSGPVLVHCLNGCDKSGLYCVLATVIERLRIEQDVDIQHIIKQMRNMRPQIIPNYEQFQFIYEAVIEYLQDFETYSNFQ